MVGIYLVFPILITVAVVTFTQLSRRAFTLVCDLLEYTTGKKTVDAIDEHPRRKSRTERKDYRESTWPTPDMEFEEDLMAGDK